MDDALYGPWRPAPGLSEQAAEAVALIVEAREARVRREALEAARQRLMRNGFDGDLINPNWFARTASGDLSHPGDVQVPAAEPEPTGGQET